MANPVSINPLANINILDSIGTFGSIALVIGIAIVIMVLLAGFLFLMIIRKQYWINIHVFRLIGNIPTRVATYKAKEVPFGLAGDKLWRVAPQGMFSLPFKIIKWLPVGKIQSAPREWWYWIRSDGEWINFDLQDIDEISKKAGVRFVQEDMRLQRLATERLLEQRLMDKSFWEKWKDTIMLIIFFLVIAVCMVLLFYQWGKLLDKTLPLVEAITKSLNIVTNTCGQEFMNRTSQAGASGLVPVG